MSDNSVAISMRQSGRGGSIVLNMTGRAVMNRWQKLGRIGCLGLLIVVAGCSLDPNKFRQVLAKYYIEPGNKALVMNTQSFVSYWAYGRQTPQDALDAAKADCIRDSGFGGADTCVTVAINDKQIYDPIPGAMADQQQQQQFLQTFVEELGSFRR